MNWAKLVLPMAFLPQTNMSLVNSNVMDFVQESDDTSESDKLMGKSIQIPLPHPPRHIYKTSNTGGV